MRIGFSGIAGAGKDTIANELVKIAGGEILKFAAPLYEIMDFAQIVTKQKREKDRKFLQLVGTEWGRARNAEMWTNLLEDRIEATRGNMFVTDVRFSNEASMLRKQGFIIIRLVRDIPGIDRDAWRAHSSESALGDSDVDFTITNDATPYEVALRCLNRS